MGEAEEPRLGDREGELERELVGVATCEAVGDIVTEAVVVSVIEGDCEHDVLCDGDEERVPLRDGVCDVLGVGLCVCELVPDWLGDSDWVWLALMV